MVSLALFRIFVNGGPFSQPVSIHQALLTSLAHLLVDRAILHVPVRNPFYRPQISQKIPFSPHKAEN
jgi:hypothetical protein